MSFSRTKGVGYTLFLFFTLVGLGCHKNAAATPPPAPPPASTPAAAAPAPTITLRAQPGAIDRGGATTLQWDAKNATSVTITPGVGDVAVTGNRSVNPTSSVTYTATAMGPGGSATDTARITVNTPPPAAASAPPPRNAPNLTTEQLFEQNVKTIYFDYDKADIKPDQMSALQGNASWLKANPNVRFTIEGHCDDRGSEEYNLALGDRRANAVKEYLAAQGIPANRIMTVSYGEERPICRDETEDCFAKNRRAAFTLNQ
ncbi:MAG TPA: peptidoglycan-associated lipoprotein Pal [Terriglobia bacterium]|jgi:peptidoglycan-associated lipoprotein